MTELIWGIAIGYWLAPTIERIWIRLNQKFDEWYLVSIKNYEKAEMEKLAGQYKHYCPEFDGLAIDETCPEFEYCLCYER